MPGRVPPVQIPDDYRVFAASDLHGQLRATDRLLAAAGLTDGGGAWTAPPRTALVVTGDLVDRGPDSVGLVRRLVALRDQAAAAGSMVVLLEGNHEVQVLGGLAGVPEIQRALWVFGGAATMVSAGLPSDGWADRPAEETAAALAEAAPGFLDDLWGFAPYARWRQTLFVHGGPVPGQELDAFEASARRLWIRRDFFLSEHRFPDHEVWHPYRTDGARQVVFGHTPQPEATLYHGDRALNVDTWKGGLVTLAALPDGEDLRDTRTYTEPAEPRAVRDAPVTSDEIAVLDAGLPAVVDAWWEAARGPRRQVPGARPDQPHPAS
jgi:serine/threonine protein phosphatase 1